MRLSDRLNARVLRLLQSKRPARNGGACIAAQVIELDRLVAVMADRFTGTDMILLGELRDCTVIVTDEHDPAWADAVEALDRSGRGTYLSPEWMTRLLADAGRTPITLIAAEDPA